MEILGAGFCRTGTMSTRKALVDLGLGPCFHMENVVKENLLMLFIDYFKGDTGPLIAHLKREGFKATLDFPIISIVDELIPHFPNAKVLLNVRDRPEAWVKSFRTSVWRVMNMPSWVCINQLLGPPLSVVSSSTMNKDLHDLTFQRIIEKGNQVATSKLPDYNRSFTDEQYAQLYTNWVDFVKQTVPKEKLLIFNVKQGIEPLATFCGRPQPEWKMPYVNDSEDFNFFVKLTKRVALFMYLLLAVLAFGLYDNCSYCTYVPIAFVLIIRFVAPVIGTMGKVESKKNK